MIDQLKPYLASLTQYMVNSGMELAPLPKVIFKQDEENAENVLARTAHYDPENKIVVVYITGRHPKCILKSICHELYHHHQNMQGRLTNYNTTNVNEDDKLLEIERETYEQSGLIFRKWENQYKNK